MKKFISSFVIASTLAVLFNPFVQTTHAATFKDVNSSHWAKSAIDEAVAKGYFKGYADGTFKPSAQVTRAEFAVLLDRVSSNEKREGNGSFTDLAGNWSEKEVNEAVSKGFLNPSDYPNGFKPTTPLTRQEMAKWMSSGLSVSEDYKQALIDTTNTVVPVAEYFKKTMNKNDYPYVSLMIGTGLMSGYADGTFGGSKTTTRAEAAVILVRLADVQKQKADSFSGLREIREVGTTGTNMNEVTAFNSGNTSFKNIQGKKANYRYGAGSTSLEYLIFVDGQNWKNKKSIYAPIFVSNDENGNREKGYVRAYVSQKVFPYKNEFSLTTYMSSFMESIARGNAIYNNLPERYGYKTLDSENADGQFKPYINKKEGMNIWTFSYISVSNPATSFKAEDGSYFMIAK